MDVLLLGAAAIVLIALTVWIVWRPDSAVRAEEGSTMLPPQGDTFEDQYTSATADLSAGGVAVTTATDHEPATLPVPDQAPTAHPGEASTASPTASTGYRAATTGYGAASTGDQAASTGNAAPGTGYAAASRVSSSPPAPLPGAMRPALPAPTSSRRPMSIGIGAAAALTLASAAAGAWLYSRWQNERNKPINRLRRRFK